MNHNYTNLLWSILIAVWAVVAQLIVLNVRVDGYIREQRAKQRQREPVQK